MDKKHRDLLYAAAQAALLAYAPYSRFRVGAAVLAGGQTHLGANVENACANLGVCAERVALAHARMHGAAEVDGLALCCLDAAPDADLRHALPCGGCRQWLAELAPRAWVVTSASERVFTLADLLPLPFALPSENK